MNAAAPRPTHPGTVLFEDSATGEVEERDFDSVPDRVAFTRIEGVVHPVVRVVLVKDDQGVTQQYFGADGQLLATSWEPHGGF